MRFLEEVKVSGKKIALYVLIALFAIYLHEHFSINKVPKPKPIDAFTVGGDAIPAAYEPCARASNAVLDSCVTEYENAWEDQGGSNYARDIKLRDVAICRHISETAFIACKGK